MSRQYLNLITLVGLLCLCPGANAVDLRHFLRDNDSATSSMTLGACSLYTHSRDRLWCNPSLIEADEEKTLQFTVISKIDETSAAATTRMLGNRITKEFITELFEHRNFEQYSLLTRIETIGPYLMISYVPKHYLGAYRISNPGFPEVSMVTVEQSIFRASSGSNISALESELFQVRVGASLAYYNRNQFEMHSNAIDAVSTPISQLIERNQFAYIDLDLHFTILSKHPWVPSLAIQTYHLSRPYRSDNDFEDYHLNLNRAFSHQTVTSLAYDLKLPSGYLNLAVRLPTFGFFESIDPYSSSIATSYVLGRFATHLAFSPLMESFGFTFASEHYRLGVQYSNEKQANMVQVQRHDNIYLFGGLSL